MLHTLQKSVFQYKKNIYNNNKVTTIVQIIKQKKNYKRKTSIRLKVSA